MPLSYLFSKNKSAIFLSLLLTFCLSLEPAVAAEFGRFMTTPKERKHLDELRYVDEDAVVEVSEDEILLDEDDTAEVEIPEGSITAKGLVYRTKGRSSAWINDSNSYEGDVSSNHIVISSDDIRQNKLYIGLSGEQDKVQLKVGQTFEPEAKTLTDLTDNTSSAQQDFESDVDIDDEL